MKVTSKIKINQTAIKAITAKAQAALEHTAEELHKEVEQAQVIPRDTGTLQNESTFVDTSQSGQGRFQSFQVHPMQDGFTITLNITFTKMTGRKKLSTGTEKQKQ